MTSESAITDNTTSPPQETVTRIKSPAVLRVIRIVFYVFLIIGVLYNIQVLVKSIEYFQDQAEQLLDGGVVATVYPWLMMVVRAVVTLIFIGVGWVIFVRRGDDRMAIIASFFLIAFGIGGIGYTQYVADATEYLKANNLYLVWLVYGSLAWLLLFAFFYIFPDGRFIPRWSVLGYLFAAIIVLAWAMPTSSPLYPDNWHIIVFAGLHIPIFFIPLILQFYRYRNVLTPVQRQQTKWALYCMSFTAFFAVTLTTASTTMEKGTLNYEVLALFIDVSYVFVPVALGFAMLRSRLWDIDILINRSLAYSIVAGAGLLVFFATVVGLQLVIGQTQPLIALLVAGGFSLAVFRPLHERAQKIIDHNIYHFRFLVDDLRKADQTPEIKNPGALTGKQLGAYTILGVLGKGGMGEVYKGQDGNHIVALKILADELAHQSEFLARFQREAETGMALDHPHIVRVHDVGAADGLHYMAMDYVEGFDMARHLKQRSPIPPEDTFDLLKSIAHALDYAHSQGLVHRDLKPSNIMLRPRADQETYDAVLMDFGIAKISSANTRYTGTGTIGTIDYMAPEQITTAREVDHRADIYALGIMAYEMLTGKRPFEGSAPQVMFAHLQQPAPDPRDIQPDVPRTTARAILKALEKNPEDRFDSAGAFLNALMGS